MDMDIDEPAWPVLDDFFTIETMGRAPATGRRYLRVRQRLLHFLETADVAPSLGTHEGAILDAERQFHPEGAFWMLFGPDELVCCLPQFITAPWLPDTAAEARTQISLVARLLKHLDRRHLLDMSIVRCAWWDAEAAVRHARAELDARSKEVAEQRPEMPARFRQPPGPMW